ncbi:hypothetical protein TNCV_3505971 [Trichonephila clavipes]|uniref:Uncharacterized protein n=1 Tax=Trichonephila clavipes TaxID=2585209 RepID=A0A8X6RVS2_TRICX|nr:hypothetical protein TNCV_3505971 [Trichonephila clavipes]
MSGIPSLPPTHLGGQERRGNTSQSYEISQNDLSLVVVPYTSPSRTTIAWYTNPLPFPSTTPGGTKININFRPHEFLSHKLLSTIPRFHD